MCDPQLQRSWMPAGLVRTVTSPPSSTAHIVFYYVNVHLSRSQIAIEFASIVCQHGTGVTGTCQR